MRYGNCISFGAMGCVRISRRVGANPQINSEMEIANRTTPKKIRILRDIISP